MKNQRNIAVCIILTLVTCGIYGIYWFIVLTDDVNESAGHFHTSGVVCFLLGIITCGIYTIYWAYKMGEGVDIIKTRSGRNSSNTGIVYILLSIFGFGIITYALIQDTLNQTQY